MGKTTLARIFAKALNCESGISASPCDNCAACEAVDNGNFMDLIEVDAASRTKVDDTRELLENVQYTPSQGRFKIYLIDEVHMLSMHSFNALLKTLEEPPEHVKFLLATTNPQKLPTTILSRCIQFNLKSVESGMLASHLEKILTAEDVPFEAGALEIISRSARGSVRDSLSLLDQAIAFSNSNVEVDAVRTMLGMIDDSLVHELMSAIADTNCEEALRVIGGMAEKSVDFAGCLDEILTQLHNLIIYQFSPPAIAWKGVNEQRVSELSARIDAESLQLLYQIAVAGKRDFEFAPDPRSALEVTVVRMIAFTPDKGEGGSAPSPGRIERPSRDKTQAAEPAASSGNGNRATANGVPPTSDRTIAAEPDSPPQASQASSQSEPARAVKPVVEALHPTTNDADRSSNGQAPRDQDPQVADAAGPHAGTR